MMFPLVRDLAAGRIPVAVTCRVLGLSKQVYFKWRVNPVTDRDWAGAHLINTAIEIHGDDPEFGYRFIADELAERGLRASRNRVNRRGGCRSGTTCPSRSPEPSRSTGKLGLSIRRWLCSVRLPSTSTS